MASVRQQNHLGEQRTTERTIYALGYLSRACCSFSQLPVIIEDFFPTILEMAGVRDVRQNGGS